jgi:hypothetical protein
MVRLRHVELAPWCAVNVGALVEQNMGALLTDRVGVVMSALKQMRCWIKTGRKALVQRTCYVEWNRTRIRYQAPWHRTFAVGSGAVERT